jgi:multicomponent Na+:H+ antiporter subunit C
MNMLFIYTLTGTGLFFIGLYALIIHANLLRKILALNIMGSGVFLVLISLAMRSGHSSPDAVSHAMVITGIVVAVSATALGLVLMLRVIDITGNSHLHEQEEE